MAARTTRNLPRLLALLKAHGKPGMRPPLALLALIAYPIVWLLLIPFRIAGIAVDGGLGIVRGIFMLPVRLLGGPRP